MKLANNSVARMFEGLKKLGALAISNYEVNYAIERNQARLKPIVDAYTRTATILNQEFAMLDVNDKAGRKGLQEEGLALDLIETEVKILKIKRSILKKMQEDKKPEGITANIIAEINEAITDDVPATDITEE